MSSQFPNDAAYDKPTAICGLPIQVWRFKQAPQELQDLSHHGGDEDWIAIVPPEYDGDYIGWLDSGGPFGCCDVSEHDHPEWKGYKVYIGAHA